MKIIKLDIGNRRQLNKLGYDSKNYYCGNYSMQKYYSYIYNKLQKLGVKSALNRGCFIHDVNYGKKPTIKEKIKIDNQFYLDMQKCILFEYRKNNIKFKHALYLRGVSLLFYSIVILCTPLYLKQKKIKK